MSEANLDSSQNMLLLKNPRFLPNQSETLLKYSSLEYPILTKFRNDWVKIVDFLIKVYFCLVSLINEQSLCLNSNIWFLYTLHMCRINKNDSINKSYFSNRHIFDTCTTYFCTYKCVFYNVAQL